MKPEDDMIDHTRITASVDAYAAARARQDAATAAAVTAERLVAEATANRDSAIERLAANTGSSTEAKDAQAALRTALDAHELAVQTQDATIRASTAAERAMATEKAGAHLALLRRGAEMRLAAVRAYSDALDAADAAHAAFHDANSTLRRAMAGGAALPSVFEGNVLDARPLHYAAMHSVLRSSVAKPLPTPAAEALAWAGVAE